MSTIEVGSIYADKSSALLGVQVSHYYYNAGDKEINYLTFTYVPYNAVHDVVACTQSGRTEVKGEITGPIYPEKRSRVKWEEMWYNPTVSYVKLTHVHIQFMDGTTEEIDGKDIVRMESEESKYYQTVTKKANTEDSAEELRELSGNYEDTMAGIAEIFETYRDDIDCLKKLIGHIRERVFIYNRYLIGDYLEKEYSSNEEIMAEVVEMWKECILQQQRMPKQSGDNPCKGFPEKYTEKIKKYDPNYVMYKIPASELTKKLFKKFLSVLGTIAIIAAIAAMVWSSFQY